MITYLADGSIYKQGVHGRMFYRCEKRWIRSSKTLEEVVTLARQQQMEGEIIKARQAKNKKTYLARLKAKKNG